MKKRFAPWPHGPCGGPAWSGGCWTAAALAALALPAWADDDPNPYSIGVSQTVTHDSNLFRAQSGTPESPDWTSATGLIASINQPIGRERLKADGEFDFNRFKRNQQLNSASHAINVEGDWATIDDLSGELGYRDSSQLYRYNLDSTRTLTAKNTQDLKQGFARVHLGVVTRWTIDASFNGTRVDYSAPSYKFRDLRRWDGMLGTSYESSSALRTSLSFRHTSGQYPNYQPTVSDDFTRNDIVLGMIYVASGASTFRANVNSTREDHTVISSRSYQTWSADGRWIWTPTGRTQFTLDFVRDDDTGSTETPFFFGDLSSTDARRRTAVTGTVGYELTSKIKLNANGSFSKRDLDTAFSNAPELDARGNDRLYMAGLGLGYTPTRAIQLGCNASYEKRTTRGAPISITYPYAATVYSCNGQFSFN